MTALQNAVNQSKFFRYWANKAVAALVPVKVYQSQASCHFEKNYEQGVEALLRRSHVLRTEFLAAGFVELDAWYFTSAMWSPDIHYDGCPRRMANQILFNIMCNQD